MTESVHHELRRRTVGKGAEESMLGEEIAVEELVPRQPASRAARRAMPVAIPTSRARRRTSYFSGPRAAKR